MAEMIGTFFLVFAGCGSVIVGDIYLDPVPVAPVFGLVVMAMIYAVGHISGAHFNPAVTLAFLVARHFPTRQLLPYWLFQVMGAFLAMIVLIVLFPEAQNLGATVPVVDSSRAFLMEVILSFALMFVIIAVATDTRAVGLMAGVAIGATVALCAWIGGPVTGASMNPARSLAPNIFQGEVTTLWIYILAPMVGTVLAALIYEWIRRCEVKPTDKKAGEGCC